MREQAREQDSWSASEQLGTRRETPAGFALGRDTTHSLGQRDFRRVSWERKQRGIVNYATEYKVTQLFAAVSMLPHPHHEASTPFTTPPALALNPRRRLKLLETIPNEIRGPTTR